AGGAARPGRRPGVLPGPDAARARGARARGDGAPEQARRRPARDQRENDQGPSWSCHGEDGCPLAPPPRPPRAAARHRRPRAAAGRGGSALRPFHRGRRLWRVAGRMVENERAPAAARGASRPAVRPLVVVVDDDPSVRKALQRLLRSADYEVEAFASAAEALA